MWHRQAAKENDLGGEGCGVEVLAPLMTTAVMVIAGINAVAMLSKAVHTLAIRLLSFSSFPCRRQPC